MEDKDIKPKQTIKKANSNKIGGKFEEQVMSKCEQYRKEDRGYLFKVATPWTVLRKGARIVSAFAKDKSNVDFWGMLPNGKVIVIETKSCSNKTSFPLNNIKAHQFDFFVEITKYSDLAFYIIEMREVGKTFLIYAQTVEHFRQTETRKSLPLTWLEENGTLIEELDFLTPLGY